MSDHKKFNPAYCKRQYELTILNVHRCNAEIVSGAYKLEKLSRLANDSELNFPTEQRFSVELTDNEKLQRKIMEMKRHIHMARELSETLGEWEAMQ